MPQYAFIKIFNGICINKMYVYKMYKNKHTYMYIITYCMPLLLPQVYGYFYTFVNK